MLDSFIVKNKITVFTFEFIDTFESVKHENFTAAKSIMKQHDTLVFS